MTSPLGSLVLSAEPEDNEMSPLLCCAAVEVSIEISPETPDTEAPDLMRTAPPVLAPVDVPAEMAMLAPRPSEAPPPAANDISPLGPPTESPVCTASEPEYSPDDEPVDIAIFPDTPAAFPEPNTTFPEGPVNDLPDRMSTFPPPDVVLSPARSEMAAPADPPPLVESMICPPELTPVPPLSPLLILMSPEVPVIELPVLILISPLLPSSSIAALINLILPERPVTDLPEVIIMDPPELEALSPADILT
jgi:hypothetical protein